MSPASYGIAFEKRTVSLLIIPYLFEVSLTIFNIAVGVLLSLVLLLSYGLFNDLLVYLLVFYFWFGFFLQFFITLLFLFLNIWLQLWFLLHFHFLFLLLFDLPNYFVYSIFMRYALNIGRQNFLFPFYLSTHPSEIHLLHLLILALFMKQTNFRFLFREDQQPARAFV